MFAELVMLVFIHDNLNHRITMTLFQVYALLSLSIANLLIPAIIVRDYVSGTTIRGTQIVMENHPASLFKGKDQQKRDGLNSPMLGLQ
jgi:hypothetical protein